MLYPLSYEGRPAALPDPEPTVLALVRGFGWAVGTTTVAGGSVSRCCPAVRAAVICGFQA
jgi:hypothetical protein